MSREPALIRVDLRHDTRLIRSRGIQDPGGDVRVTSLAPSGRLPTLCEGVIARWGLASSAAKRFEEEKSQMVEAKTVQKMLEQAKERTRLRILQDKVQVPRELYPTLEHIAEFFFSPELNVTHLIRARKLNHKAAAVFSEKLGVGVKEYLQQHRRATAQWLLETTDVPIRRIAEVLNYSQIHNFRRDFRKWTGETAADYRQRRRGAEESEPAALPSIQIRWLASVGKLPPNRVQRFFEFLEERFSAPPEDQSPLMGFPRAVLIIAGHRHGEAQAELAWRVIRDQPPERQHHVLRHEILCGSRALFNLLSTKSRVNGRRDRQRGVELAELALSSVEGSAALLGDIFHDVHALGLARLGNALRLAGDYVGSEKAFAHSEAAWALPRATPDPRVEAEIWDLKASLRLHQRRYEEAHLLLNRSLKLSEGLGELRLQVSSLLQRATVLNHQGQNEASISDLRLAKRVVRDLREPRLALGVFQSLAASQAEAGDFSKAVADLAEAQKLCEAVNEPLSRHQLEWVEGRLYQREGAFELAASLFNNARAGLIELNEKHYAAEVSLDLAIVQHGLGRFTEVLELVVEDVIPVFESLKSNREILAGLNLLREAVGANKVRLGVLRQARACIRDYHGEPAH